MWIMALMFGLFGVEAGGGPAVTVAGIVLRVEQPARVQNFLSDIAPFEVLAVPTGQVLLRTGEMYVLLERAEPEAAPKLATVSLNFSVADLERATERCLQAGGELLNAAPMSSQIGPFNGVRIPGCRQRIHLMKIEAFEVPPGFFNAGLRVDDLTHEEDFYESLGLVPSSRDYLPTTLPYHRSGAMAMVLHPLYPGQRADAGGAEILLLTEGVTPASISARFGGEIRSPSGYRFRLFEPPRRASERAMR